jgi:EF-P beta-lysylation protein EpmB
MRWQHILKNNFREWDKLACFLELSKEQQERILPTSSFPLNLPLRLAQKIQKKTLDDPILKQFIPLKKEEQFNPNCSSEPTKDFLFRPCEKLLHKYQGRSLLITTQVCAMHCRYCFRRNFSYQQTDSLFTSELLYLNNHPEIHEVILSGGDPLSLPNSKLSHLINELEKIDHLKFIRWHTRFPIGIPERIDHSFVNLLTQSSKQHFFVIHCNHPKEMDHSIYLSLKKLQQQGIPILNQSVLLKGVNNSLATLKTLCLELASHGIINYYLHFLDRVEGAGHFIVPRKEALSLYQQLIKEIPGYTLPRFVEEIPGKESKTPVA